MHIVAVNPFSCRIWSLHPRLDENITEESCRAQIESIERGDLRWKAPDGAPLDIREHPPLAAAS